MNGIITIRRELGSLSAREYDFDMLDSNLRCIRYRALSRATKRQRKETSDAFWSWYPHERQRRSGLWTTASEVPYDDSISCRGQTDPDIENSGRGSYRNMRAYDNRITQADAARRLKNMAKFGHKAVAGVRLETTVAYAQYLDVATLILDRSDGLIEGYYLRKSGQCRRMPTPEAYMPMQTPGIRATSADVLTLDTEAVLATYKRWQKAQYLLHNPGGEKDWEWMEQKEQDAIRRHWDRRGPAS